jgi:hypothetical protein
MAAARRRARLGDASDPTTLAYLALLAFAVLAAGALVWRERRHRRRVRPAA